MTAGDQVCASAAAGRTVKTVPASSSIAGANVIGDAARSVIGVALTGGGDGQLIRWMLR